MSRQAGMNAPPSSAAPHTQSVAGQQCRVPVLSVNCNDTCTQLDKGINAHMLMLRAPEAMFGWVAGVRLSGNRLHTCLQLLLPVVYERGEVVQCIEEYN